MFMFTQKSTCRLALTITALLMTSQAAHAALALDRTRAILDGGEKSLSMSVTNQNRELPFLAQAWVEDGQGKKLTDPLVALPPVQRIEPGSKTQVKVQASASMNTLPQDRESLFYFNLREIPPKSSKPNTLQLALQTRIKLFYRPAPLAVNPNDKPWQEKVTLTREGGKFVANNPTPYFVSIIDAAATEIGNAQKGFKPVMIAPKSSAPLSVDAGALGNSPVLTYINDYGGRPKLIFACAGNTCSVKEARKG